MDNYVNATGVQAIKTWVDGKFATQTELDALDDRVDDLVTQGGEPNTINSITVNGATVTPDAQKTVAITVPTKTSDLTNDGDGASNFATEAYVTTNGGKIDKISVNNVEQTITNKTVNITVPAKVSELQNDGDGTTGSTFATKKYVDDEAGTIRAIKVNGTAQTITSKEVDITVPTKLSELTNDADFLTESEIDTKIDTAVTAVFKYKGAVATVADLPATGNTKGDVYDVQSTGVNYAWSGTAWDALGTYVDTSLLWAQADLTAMTVAEINAILNA